MTPDDIEKAIHVAVQNALACELPAAVNTAVEAAVNGKVKALATQMKPITDAYTKWLSWRRGAAIFIGAIIAIMGFVNALQEGWGFVTSHFVVK